MGGLQALLRNKIKVFFTQGQHEYQEIPWALLATGCQHVHKQAFQICGVNFYGLDYMPEAELQEAIKQIPPETTVMVMHQVWSDFMGDIAKPQGSFADLPAHVKLLITGDFHETHNFTTDAGLTVLSPGSSHLRSIQNHEPDCTAIGYDNRVLGPGDQVVEAYHEVAEPVPAGVAAPRHRKLQSIGI